MNIRPATSQDRSAIIGLLRQSLGESTIPKSEALWAWKHEENPFGQSFVLVAEENNTVIGVRAFMQWRWLWKGQPYQAIRAVDTATHPEHQGKGIFKKLTLQQLELCKKEGVHFVFNTPNEQSRPGYLKMGWVQQGKMMLKIKLLRPISTTYAKFFDKQKHAQLPEDPTPHQEWPLSVSALANNYVQKTEQLATILTPQYIDWRYRNNPLFRYNYFTDNENYLLVCRVKNHSFTKELRLADFLLFNPNADVSSVSSHIRKQVRKYCKEQGCEIISFSGQQYNVFKPYFGWMGLLPVKPLGPIITVRDLNMNDQFNELLKTENWCYSLGDLELF